MKSIYYVAFEILSLFALGGIYYLFQRRKYIRLHEETTRDFMNQIKEAQPDYQLPDDTRTFEMNFTHKYKVEKNLDSYSPPIKDVYIKYLDYIESISGPLA